MDLDDANTYEIVKCPELGVNDLMLADVERRLDDELWDSNDDLLGDEIRVQAPRGNDVLLAIPPWHRIRSATGIPQR